MDTTFLSCLLLCSLLIILALYLYQNTPSLHFGKGKRSNGNSMKHEAFFPVIWDTCKTGRTSGMPVHRVGPVYNFHQHFNKYSPSITCIKPSSIPEGDNKCNSAAPTGIPELGWRNYYINKYSNNEIKETDPFSGTSIRNFLNNMENVDNIYRKCL